jgi:hypothetical protein
MAAQRGEIDPRASLVQHVPVSRDVTGWVRKFDRHKKLNDEVENVHGSLSWSDKAEEYFRLLDATHNSRLSKVRSQPMISRRTGCFVNMRGASAIKLRSRT